MNETLSVIVPVFNVQNSLAREVHELLDVLSDIAASFELLLVDDGSTDHTGEVADELARQFPQIRSLHQQRRSGMTAAVQSGLRHATGEYIFVQDQFSTQSRTELRRLWAARQESLAAPARVTTPGGFESQLLKRLTDWGFALRKHEREQQPHSGTQLFRRHASRPATTQHM